MYNNPYLNKLNNLIQTKQATMMTGLATDGSINNDS